MIRIPTPSLNTVGRIAVGLGSATALAAATAVVVAHGASGLRTERIAGRPDVVRLEPVVVTISAERFAAIRAESEPVLAAARPTVVGRRG